MTTGQNVTVTKGKFFYGYIIVLVSFLISLIAWGPTYSYGIFIKPLQDEFLWSRGVTSLAYSLLMFFRGLFHIFAGRMTDRFGPRIVTSVFTVFLGLGYILMSQVNTVWQLYLYYGVIVALGLGGAYIPLASTIARWFIKRRALMTGILLAGVGTGTMVWPLIVGWLISAYNWRTTFTIIGITSLVLIIAAAQFLKYSPAQAGLKPYGSATNRNEPSSATLSGISFPQAIRTRQFWLVLGMQFCQMFCIQLIMVHVVPYLTDQEILPIVAATTLTIIGGTNLVARIASGGLADRIGTKKGIIIGSILMSAAFFWLLGTNDWLSATKEMWTIYLFAIAFGLAYGGVYTLGSPLAAELFGLRSHGVILGTATFAGTFGGAVGPAIAGYIFDINGDYQMAFLAAILISIIGLILILLLRPITARESELTPTKEAVI